MTSVQLDVKRKVAAGLRAYTSFLLVRNSRVIAGPWGWDVHRGLLVESDRLAQEHAVPLAMKHLK